MGDCLTISHGPLVQDFTSDLRVSFPREITFDTKREQGLVRNLEAFNLCFEIQAHEARPRPTGYSSGLNFKRPDVMRSRRAA